MSDPAPMAERHVAVLTELAELGMALARKLQDRAMAAETAEAERTAAISFHRISRSLRQTLALEAQLERCRRRMLREDIEDARKRTAQAVERRKAQVRPAVERLVWREHDGETADGLVEHLGDLLDEDALEDDFLSISVDDHIARLRGDLGLKPDDDDDPAAVSLRPGATPDPGDPGRLAEPAPRLGSPAPPSGRAADDAGWEGDDWRSSG